MFTIKRCVLIGVALAFLSGSAICDEGDAGKNAGEKADKTAQKTGEEVDKGAEEAGEKTGKAVKKTGKSIEKGAKKVGTKIEGFFKGLNKGEDE